VVERTLAWLSKCRAILVRWDTKARNYLGLLQARLLPHMVAPLPSLGAVVDPAATRADAFRGGDQIGAPSIIASGDPVERMTSVSLNPASA
jgi:hypothetical protein